MNGNIQRNVGTLEALKLAFANYTTFNGRSSRGAFWWWVVATFILSWIANGLDIALGLYQPNGLWPISMIFELMILPATISLGVRRLHDIGKSGWWLLLGLAPIIGWIALAFLFSQPGKREDLGKYGADVEAGR